MFEELENLKDEEGLKGLKEMMREMVERIHPDIGKVASLTAALKRIQDTNEVLELSEDLSDKLCNIQLDLHSLIKEIIKEKELPDASLHAMEAVLGLPNKEEV